MNELSMQELWSLVWNWWVRYDLGCDLIELVGNKVAWHWCEMEFHIHGLRIMGCYGFIRTMTEVDYEALVCDICIYIYIYICMCMLNPSWLIEYDWSVSVRNSLKSLGEIFRVVLQWSGRNSMAPVSGCPWWIPIYITW